MLAQINTMLDMPITLFVVLAIGAVIGMGVERASNSFERARKRAYWQAREAERRDHKKIVQFGDRKATITTTAADQLARVMQAPFKPRALLNRPERRLLGCIDKALMEFSPGWRAMGQVSMGEILYSHDKDAFWAINAKRVDLLIIDRDCRPLHAVEFQGTGHHGSPETAARDAVKKEALRRAGIGYVEVVSGNTPSEVREMIRKLVERSGIQREARQG